MADSRNEAKMTTMRKFDFLISMAQEKEHAATLISKAKVFSA
jgi:hypothetical protein